MADNTSETDYFRHELNERTHQLSNAKCLIRELREQIEVLILGIEKRDKTITGYDEGKTGGKS